MDIEMNAINHENLSTTEKLKEKKLQMIQSFEKNQTKVKPKNNSYLSPISNSTLKVD